MVIHFEGKAVPVRDGQSIRDALLAAGLSPHNGNAAWFNCKGLGTCGTCAVHVDGPVTPASPREQVRLSFPPHRLERGLRLACQARPQGDVTVTKFTGFWGQDKTPRR